MRPENTAMKPAMLSTVRKSAMGQLCCRRYQRKMNGGRIPLTKCEWTARTTRRHGRLPLDAGGTGPPAADAIWTNLRRKGAPGRLVGNRRSTPVIDSMDHPVCRGDLRRHDRNAFVAAVRCGQIDVSA
jgi:hypothetical protein